jgi:hypothetical protein
MSHLDISQRAHASLLDSCKAVRAYADSELSKHAIDMLDALAAGYCVDLIHVQPEGLVRLQSALQQVSALRDVFANDGADIPKI